MAFPTIVTQSISGTTTEATSHTITLPASIVSGNLLLAFVSGEFGGNGSISGWTTHTNYSIGNTGLAIFYKIAGSSESNPSFSIPDSRSIAYAVYQISGAATSGATESQVATTSYDPPSLTPTWGSKDTLWFAVCTMAANAGNTGFSAFPSGYSNTNNSNYSHGPGNAYGQVLGVCNKGAAASSDDPSSFTGTSAFQYLSSTLAVKPADSINSDAIIFGHFA